MDLFIKVWDGIIKNCKLGGAIIKKSVQVVSHTDELVVIAGEEKTLRKAQTNIIEESRKTGLNINEGKTEYVATGKKLHQNIPGSINIENLTFDRVENFKYLGVMINSRNERKT